MISSAEESDLEESVVTAIPPDLLNAAQQLKNNLLPVKSKEKYNAVYENFITLSLAVKYKAGSLWATYSMLKCTLKVKNGVNIDQYLKLKAFLKSEGYVPKRSKILSGDNVDKFIKEAPAYDYLATKVALILGVTGALRGQELCDITYM